MTTRLSSALARLRQADRVLRDLVGVPMTLRAGADRATSVEELGEQLLADKSAATVAAFAEGVSKIVEAQVRSFPETIFWDLDFMAVEILALDDASQIARLCGEIAALQTQYGRHSVLCFRYAHDFTYGYDWAKWVMREPSSRRDVRPFAPRFIRHLRRRGEELVTLIEQDDEKYPKLPDGRPRNPFGFSREPDHEVLLFRDLAEHHLLPVEAWDMNAELDPERPYADLRAQRARRLGVPTRRSTDG